MSAWETYFFRRGLESRTRKTARWGVPIEERKAVYTTGADSPPSARRNTLFQEVDPRSVIGMARTALTGGMTTGLGGEE